MNHRIDVNSHRCQGLRVARGTRTPVSVVLSALAGGDAIEAVAADYGITPDDVQACLEFARHGGSQAEVRPP